ncbi:MAG: alpha-mannosidase, partial [Bacillota bacterium]|nr:alpha-mannosidase [Bacillota bacterium]
MYYQLQQVERICKDLNHLIDQNPLPVRDILYQPVHHQTPAEADNGDLLPFGSQDRWGGYDAYAWFRADVTLPQAYAGRKVVLEITVDQEHWTADSRQFILFVGGEMKQGVDVNHRRIVLCHDAVAGTTFRLDLQAYAGLVEKRTGLEMRLIVEDEAVKAVYYDLHVPCQVAAELPEGDKTRLDILHVLNQAIRLLDLRKPESQAFTDSVQRTRQFMETEFYQKLCGQQPIQATAVGHTHIDVAWLWTLAQTRQKIARSFSTVLQLMDLYPDYVFMSSQPQLYSYLQKDYPEVFQRVKERIAEG